VILHFPDRFWPNDKTILVVMAIGAVEIGVEAQLRGITFGEKILAENIRDQNC
jgi:hypothetical protein